MTGSDFQLNLSVPPSTITNSLHIFVADISTSFKFHLFLLSNMPKDFIADHLSESDLLSCLAMVAMKFFYDFLNF